MKGVNEIRINHATMIEVAQRWVDDTIKSKPTVKEVVFDTSASAGGFRIKLESTTPTTN